MDENGIRMDPRYSTLRPRPTMNQKKRGEMRVEVSEANGMDTGGSGDTVVSLIRAGEPHTYARYLEGYRRP